MIAVLVLLFTGILTTPLSILSDLVYRAFDSLVTIPLRLIFG